MQIKNTRKVDADFGFLQPPPKEEVHGWDSYFYFLFSAKGDSLVSVLWKNIRTYIHIYIYIYMYE